jgi:hypothetical protein
MLSARIPISLKERLTATATTARLSFQDIVIAALTAELDVLDEVLAERAAVESSVRAQNKRQRIDGHTKGSTREKTETSKRIPKSS